MLLSLQAIHKQHLLFLTEQNSQVLQDFCKLALDYIQKGPNFKLYNAAAQKLEVDPETIKKSVEALVNLLLESCKYKLSEEDFRDSVLGLGFSEETQAILSKLYNAKKEELSQLLSSIGLKLTEYHNMEWRFEIQVATKSLLNQVTPLITLDLALKNSDDPENLDHILLQTDATNLLHLTQELEMALQEGRSQHIRRITRAVK